MNQFLLRAVALSVTLFLSLNLSPRAWAQNTEALDAPAALTPENELSDVPEKTDLTQLDDQGLDDIVVNAPDQEVRNGERKIIQNQANGVIKEIEVKSTQSRYVLRPPLNIGAQTLQPAMWELGTFNESARKNSVAIVEPPSTVTPTLPKK